MKTRSLLKLVLIIFLLASCSSETKSLKVSPSKIDFGNINIGDNVDMELTLTNKYGKDVFITDIGIIGSSDFAITAGATTPINMIKNATHKLTIKFTPTTNIPYNAILNNT